MTKAKASPKWDQMAAQSLRCDYHLACVSGPDRGMVAPLTPGFVMGRHALRGTDRYMSRVHAQVVESSKSQGTAFTLGGSPGRRHRKSVGRLRPLAPSNPLPSGRDELPLSPWQTILVGSGHWQVRPRPTYLDWPARTVSTQAGGWLKIPAFIMPVALLFMLTRWLPPQVFPSLVGAAVFICAIALGFWFRRFRRWDEGRLLQVSAATQAAPPVAPLATRPNEQVGSGVTAVRLLRAPRRPRRITLRHGVTGTVGPCAERYAQWLSLQIRTLGLPTSVIGGEGDEPDSDSSTSTLEAAASYIIAWAPKASQLPVATMRVLLARCVGSPGWVRQSIATAPDAGLPDFVSLSDLLGAPDATRITGRWLNPDTPLVAVDVDGPVAFDLIEDGPHGLIAGGTGSGKSEFLATMVLSYAATYPPSLLRFVFIDYKGGAGLDHLADLPHVEHSMTDLDASQTPWLLRALSAVLRSRKAESAALGVRSWEEWWSAWDEGACAPPPPRLLIIADEFRVLVDSHPELMTDLTKITTQGRSLGMHLVVSTQRPGGAVSANMRATLDARFALRCAEPADSIETIGDRRAADLPRIPGRAIFNGRTLQAAYVQDPKRWVSAIADATQTDLEQYYGPHGAQVPQPLPSTIPAPHETQPAGCLGYAEDPLDSGLRYFQLPKGALVFLGPPSHTSELSELALSAATVGRDGAQHSDETAERLIWLGDYPPSAQAKALEKRFGTIIPRADLGTHVRALNLLAQYRGGPVTVVITEASSLLRDLEVAAGSRAPLGLLQSLIRTANLPGSSTLNLVLTDTKPSSVVEEVPHRLIRLATANTLISPVILPFLPQNPTDPASQLTNYLSSTWGRVVYSSVGCTQPQWVQLSGLPQPEHLPATDTSDFLRLTPPEMVEVLCGIPTREGATPTDLLILASDRQGKRVVELLRKSLPHIRIRRQAPSQWPQLATREGPSLLIEPAREALRSVSTRFPDSQLELAASYPLERTKALYVGPEGPIVLNLPTFCDPDF